MNLTLGGPHLARRTLLAGAASAMASSVVGISLPAIASPMSGKVERFQVRIPEARLQRIRERVRDFPWYAAPIGADGSSLGWRYGTDIGFLRRVAARWAGGYDWRATETRLNTVPNFLAEVDGRRLHFIHEPGSGPAPRPLLIIHGWPYTAFSYADLVMPLAHPERFGGDSKDAFSVVVVSAPGYLFSDAPAAPEGLRAFGRLYHRLMTEILSFPRYLLDGGDQGAISASWMALDFPASVIGLHHSAGTIFPRHAESPFASGQVGPAPSAEELAYAKAEVTRFQEQSAYFSTQLSRPETLSPAMMDSPVGQASWLIDKYHYWTDRRDGREVDQAFGGMDRLLDEVMFYVATDSFRTSLWPYAAFQTEIPALPRGVKITVPVGVTAWPDPLAPIPPRRFVERARPNIVQWTEPPRGGHFPFLEAPQLWLDDLRAFGRKVA